MAEGLLRHLANERGLNWEVSSAGTEPYHVGEAPHRFSQQVCREHGIDISAQRARQLRPADFGNFDKIYAMAGDVYAAMKRIGGPDNNTGNTGFFLDELYGYNIAKGVHNFGPEGAYRDHRGRELDFSLKASVPDPYYGGLDGYYRVYDLVAQTCNAIISNYTGQ